MNDTGIVGSHPIIQAIGSAIDRLANGDATVLVTGEKGTGKGLIARQLHVRGSRATRPFVQVACADAGEGRLESELFGAGTDPQPSAWRRAAGGVLLLDELTALPIELQQRLAERLQLPGDGADHPGVARVLATAECDAVTAVRSGCLDPGLLRCLEPIEIPLPALRQRRADIPVLVDHFLAAYAARHGLGTCRIETDALVHLWQYDWPGNVRELESVVERVVVLCRAGVIRIADLPAHIFPGGNGKLTAAPRGGSGVGLNGNAGPSLRSTI